MPTLDRDAVFPPPRQLRVVDADARCDPARPPRVRVGSEHHPHAQGYRLTVNPDAVTIDAHDDAGRFYAEQTLRQLAALPGPCPALTIDDDPDFPRRGVMLDVSRDRVWTMNTLRGLVDQLASWKLNELQFYTEHTFAYAGHEAVWADASPMTGEQVRELDAYCRERFIELVPNQNSFGHMERWLEHERYRPLAECPDGCVLPDGRAMGPFSLNPTDPGSLALLDDLYGQLLPHFSSGRFNVGCDETFDLGQGRSAAACRERGRHRVYLDFLKRVQALVKTHGRSMEFWGDIILEAPELIHELPGNVTALAWGYDAGHPFDEHGAAFAASGVPWVVCPGTSSWNSLAGRSSNTVANAREAAAAGRRHGAGGYLVTDWGDHGHWQPLPVSYLGLVMAAAASWNGEAAESLDPVSLLNHHAFGDATGVSGRVAFDLGDAHLMLGEEQPNGTAIFRVLQDRPPDPLPAADRWSACREVINELAGRIDTMQPTRGDADQIRDEHRWSASMMRYGCTLGEALARGEAPPAGDRALLEEHRRLWLQRSRPGGLADSTRKLAAALRLDDLK